MNYKKVRICIVLLLLAGQFTGAENLLLNPGMEEGENTNALYWKAAPYGNNPLVIRRESQNPYTGSWCVSMESPNQSDSRLIQDVRVKPDTLYKLSGWIKAENIGTDTRGANLTVADYLYSTQDFRGNTPNWQYAEMYIRTGVRTESIKVCLALGGYSTVNNGKAYFDEITLEEVAAVPENTAVHLLGAPAEENRKPEPKALFTSGLELFFKKWGTPTPLMATLVTVGLVLIILILIIVIGRKLQKPLFLKKHLIDKLPPLWPEKPGLKTLLFSPYVKFFFIACIGFVFTVDLLNFFREDFLWGSDNHYLYQAEAFLRGKFAVREYVHDMAVFNGKNYVIYPPFPIVFVLPFVALFGFNTKMILISTVIAIVSVIFFYRLLQKLEIKKNLVPWVVGAFIFGTAFWFCYNESRGVAFFAHLCAAFAVILCLNEALGKGRGLLVGLFLGMAFLSRQLTIFLIFFLVIALWERKKEEPLKAKIKNLVFMLTSLGCCVLIYLAYNYARFGNIFDTGYSYLQLGGFMEERVRLYGQFHPAYIPFNFTYLFLQGFHFEFNGLTLSDIDWFGTALTFASPFIFFALWAKWKKSLKSGAWISIAVIILAQLMYYNNGWVQINTQRFTLDFMPLLMILVALGMNELPAKYWKPVILFSVIINAFSMWVRLPPEAKRFFNP